MTTTTQDKRWSDLVGALEGFDDAERAGIVLSRQAIVLLFARTTAAFNAYEVMQAAH